MELPQFGAKAPSLAVRGAVLPRGDGGGEQLARWLVLSAAHSLVRPIRHAAHVCVRLPVQDDYNGGDQYAYGAEEEDVGEEAVGGEEDVGLGLPGQQARTTSRGAARGEAGAGDWGSWRCGTLVPVPTGSAHHGARRCGANGRPARRMSPPLCRTRAPAGMAQEASSSSNNNTSSEPRARPAAVAPLGVDLWPDCPQRSPCAVSLLAGTSMKTGRR